MKQNYIVKLLLGGALVVSGGLYAQKSGAEKQAAVKEIMKDRRISDLKLSDERETPAFIQFDSKTPLPRYQTQYQLGQYLNLRAGTDELRNSKITHNKQNIDIQEYQQYYKGVPVEHGKYRALMRNENTLLAAGSYFDIPASFSTHPALTERQALNFALARVGATKYAWQQVQEMMAQTVNLQAKQALQKELNEYLPQGQLVIVKDFTKEGVAEMHLAYKYNIYAAEPLSRDWIYVDAQTGKILLRNPIIHHVGSVATTVPTRYAGNRVVYVTRISGNDPNSGTVLQSSHPTTGSDIGYVPGSLTYVLIDSTRGGTIQTYDLNGAGGAPVSLPGIYGQGKSFTDVDNNWTLAEHKRAPMMMEGGANEAENDDIAFDAHWGAEQVYDYWLKKHERLSYDGKNAAIRSFIHYGPAYDNAFWNGSVMTYGDGSGNAAIGFKALTSLDVCGHEIGHGVCSNTSDLVYEKESGAMNEALSDIWAACIENFAIDSVDGTLRTKYQPFFIGEQISFGAPLRYMDAPKGATDPDTYGGRYWVNTNCTPTLANDECGVHTNSGVLNHYFYLLTVGSGNGSGPDAEWARPGVDDQKRDSIGNTAAIENRFPYSVQGIGFELSEDITFMMEQMLTSTATYAEARSVSIAVATAIAGNPCDALVQSVTNAWNAVGVGAAFGNCVVTYGFVQASTTVSEASATGVGCNSVRTLNVPVLTPAGGTSTVTLGGTATLGDDYTVNATSFSNTAGTTTKTDQLVFSIRNDAVVENTETITLNVAVTGAGSSAVNSSYTISITDNDVVPKIGTDSVTLIDPATTGAFTASNGFLVAAGQQMAGTVTLPAFTPVLEIADDAFPANTTPNGKNQWAINNNQLVITGKVGSLTGDVSEPAGQYNPLSSSQTRIVTNSMVDARGLSNVRIAFDYTVQGEVDATTVRTNANGQVEYGSVFDYMTIVYSLDGVNYSELANDSFPRFADATPRTGRFVNTLPKTLNNQQFYIGFRWQNDANGGGPTSVAIDNLSIKGLPRKIESTLSSNAAENLVSGQDVYYYSVQDGDIIAKVNSGASTYGCTAANVENAGTGTFTFYSDGSNSYVVGSKVIRLTPTTNNPTGTNTVSVYFTQAEINAIESATMVGRTSLSLYKTTASSYTGANTSNVEKKAATYQAITLANGTVVGGVFTATFNTGFSAFALGAATPVILPVTCTDFTAKLSGSTTQLQWKLATETNNKGFDIERSLDGSTFTTIAQVAANAANRGTYTFADSKTDGLKAAYYRIRQYDVDGRSTYICQTAYVRFGGKALVIGNMYPNPVTSTGSLQISTDKAFRLQADFINVAGQTIRSAVQNIAAGDNTIQILKTKLPAGTYMLRFTDGETGTLLKTQTFIQQ